MKYRWTIENTDFLKQYYSTLGRDECSRILNIPPNKVSAKAFYHKLKLSKQTKAYQRDKKRSMNADEEINKAHMNINDPKIAYILGFLWGDGYLDKPTKSNHQRLIRLSIVEEDFVGIAHLFDGWVVKRIEPKISKDGIIRKPIITAFSPNRNLGFFLFKNDYAQKSITTPTKILSHIPEDLQSYFWRGYSDADGCFCVNLDRRYARFSLAGSYEQDYTDLEKLLLTLKIRYKITRRRTTNKKTQKIHKNSSLCILRWEDCRIFRDYIYQGDFFGFIRKFEKSNSIDILLKITPTNYVSPIKHFCIFRTKLGDWFYRFFHNNIFYRDSKFENYELAVNACYSRMIEVGISEQRLKKFKMKHSTTNFHNPSP